MRAVITKTYGGQFSAADTLRSIDDYCRIRKGSDAPSLMLTGCLYVLALGAVGGTFDNLILHFR